MKLSNIYSKLFFLENVEIFHGTLCKFSGPATFLHFFFFFCGSFNYFGDYFLIYLCFSQRMNLIVKQFSLEGLYEGTRPLQSVFTSLCCVSDWPTLLKANANHRQSCRLSLQQFETSHMHFYELYIVHQEANKTKLISVPLRVASFTRGGILRNQVNDLSYSSSVFHLTS